MCRRDIDNRVDAQELGKSASGWWLRFRIKVEDEEDLGPSNRRDVREDDGCLFVVGIPGDEVVESSINVIGLPSAVDSHAAPNLSDRIGLDLELRRDALDWLALDDLSR